MKRIVIVFWGCVLANRLWAEPDHDHPVSSTNGVALTTACINQLVEEMRTNHPAARAAVVRADAASLNTNSVRIWDDPKFLFGGSVSSTRGMKPSEEGNLIYGLEQKLPLFGKAQAARRVAQAEAETEEARAGWQFQTLRRELAKALFKVAGDDRALEIGAQDLAWLEIMVMTTENRYRSGNATQIEVLRVQNERAKRADQLRTDTLHRDHSRLTINRLLNRDLHAPLPRFELPGIAGTIHYNDRLVELAIRYDPRLRVMNHEVQQAEAGVAAARKSRLPDVGVGIGGRQYSGDGGFRGGTFILDFSVPWFNGGNYRSNVARDQDRLRAAELDALDYQLTVREDVHHLTVNIDAARREALLYRDEIVPRSDQALASAHANWLAGGGMFNDVMDARRMVLEGQIMYARAIAEQYQLMAELVLCCGLGDLEALEGIGTGIDPNSSEANQP